MSSQALPVWCTEVDLAPGHPDVPPVPGTAASVRLLVRLDGNPLGYVEVPADAPLGVVDVLDRLEPAARRLALDRRAGSPAVDALDEVSIDARVTVVVCTRNRPDVLARCLTELSRLTHVDLELLVVDNAPTDDGTRRVVLAAAAEDPRVRYALEPRPGLSRARNRGLELATGEFVAYTDDDVRVDPWWVQALLRGFHRRPDVACVSGLAVAASLDSEVEAYFDSRVSWSTLRPARLYDLAQDRDDSPMYPFAAGLFGTGANFAFRRSTLLDLGGFDVLLGAGSPTRGGEDLDAFVRVLLDGHALAFEPAALVWHHHRSSYPELRRQMYGYGTGLTAFYAKLLTDRRTRAALVRVVPPGLRKLAAVVRSSGEHEGSGAAAPRGLMVRELTGMVVGPLLYWSSRRRARESTSSRTSPTTKPWDTPLAR